MLKMQGPHQNLGPLDFYSTDDDNAAEEDSYMIP